MDQNELILPYLRRHPLKNVTPLKMLASYSQIIDSVLIEQCWMNGCFLYVYPAS